MSGRQWVRLDCGLPSHDKTLRVISQPGGWRAMTVYVFGLSWSGMHGTDGYIPRAALPFIHGTTATVRVLIDAKLWEEAPSDGWIIRNWDSRQPTQDTIDAQREAGRKAACARWHEPDCFCWKT